MMMRVLFVCSGVTSVPFRGCIRKLQLGDNVRDLNNNLYAYNVQPGCVEVSAGQAS
jgi:predicted acetyltransferase